MTSTQLTSTINSTNPIQSLPFINDFHFYDHESKILIHSSGENINVPDSVDYDLSNIEQAESHLINLGFIDAQDCVISFYEDVAA